MLYKRKGMKGIMKKINNQDYLEAANTGKNGFWIYLVVVLMTIFATLMVQAVLLGFAFFFEGNLDIFSYSPLNFTVGHHASFWRRPDCIIFGC